MTFLWQNSHFLVLLPQKFTCCKKLSNSIIFSQNEQGLGFLLQFVSWSPNSCFIASYPQNLHEIATCFSSSWSSFSALSTTSPHSHLYICLIQYASWSINFDFSISLSLYSHGYIRLSKRLIHPNYNRKLISYITHYQLLQVFISTPGSTSLIFNLEFTYYFFKF